MSEALKQAAAYDLIDRFLRNNLYDDDYAKYSDALEAISQPAPSPQPATPESVKAERDQLRCAQADAVIPLIGPLLDAWENADREVMSQEPELSKQLKNINSAMEDAQPATGEPVVELFVATYSSESIGGKQHDTGRVNKGPRGGFFASTASVEDASLIADALNAYTHPAPSVPALIEEAISSGHFGVLPMKATILMCKAGWGASGGELTFQEIGRIYEEMYKARPLPDDSSTGEPVTVVKSIYVN